eukprot:2608168-Pyramimonas_sp.AAC.2
MASGEIAYMYSMGQRRRARRQVLLHFTGPPVPITARMHSTSQSVWLGGIFPPRGVTEASLEVVQLVVVAVGVVVALLRVPVLIAHQDHRRALRHLPKGAPQRGWIQGPRGWIRGPRGWMQGLR